MTTQQSNTVTVHVETRDMPCECNAETYVTSVSVPDLCVVDNGETKQRTEFCICKSVYKSNSLQICCTVMEKCSADKHAAVQVVSMAADNVIKVWDLRNHRCIQTITDLDWPSQDDAHPSVMMYDHGR